MMDNLLESRPRKQRTTGGTVASVVFHAGLILFAVYATAQAGIAEDKAEREQKVRFVEMKKPEPKPEPPKPEPEKPKPEPPKPKPKPKVTEHRPQPLPPAPKTEIAPPKGFQTLEPPKVIASELPKIDYTAKVTNELDFSGKGTEGGSASGKEGSSGTNENSEKAGSAVDTDKTYLESQVEEPVQPAGGTQPRYPESLRSDGVSGKVLAQFVVNERGRVEPGSFKVLESDHNLFTQAVRDALPGMRFKPAKIGNTPVSQLVQQPFVFNLQR